MARPRREARLREEQNFLVSPRSSTPETGRSPPRWASRHLPRRTQLATSCSEGDESRGADGHTRVSQIRSVLGKSVLSREPRTAARVLGARGCGLRVSHGRLCPGDRVESARLERDGAGSCREARGNGEATGEMAPPLSDPANKAVSLGCVRPVPCDCPATVAALHGDSVGAASSELPSAGYGLAVDGEAHGSVHHASINPGAGRVRSAAAGSPARGRRPRLAA